MFKQNANSWLLGKPHDNTNDQDDMEQRIKVADLVLLCFDSETNSLAMNVMQVIQYFLINENT